jgi:hypothetical protein
MLSTVGEEKAIQYAYQILWDANADEQDSDLRARAFRLVLSAFKPLKQQQLLEAVCFDLDNPDSYEEYIDLSQLEGVYHNFLDISAEGCLEFEHLPPKTFVLELTKINCEDKVFSDIENHRYMADISIKALERPDHQIWKMAGIDLLHWASKLRNSQRSNYFRKLYRYDDLEDLELPNIKTIILAVTTLVRIFSYTGHVITAGFILGTNSPNRYEDSARTYQPVSTVGSPSPLQHWKHVNMPQL